MLFAVKYMLQYSGEASTDTSDVIQEQKMLFVAHYVITIGTTEIRNQKSGTFYKMFRDILYFLIVRVLLIWLNHKGSYNQKECYSYNSIDNELPR